MAGFAIVAIAGTLPGALAGAMIGLAVGIFMSAGLILRDLAIIVAAEAA